VGAVCGGALESSGVEVTDLSARLVAALHEVRARTPHDVDCNSFRISGEHHGMPLWLACNCPWAARVDARLAACVEAYGEAVGLTAWQNGAAKGDDPRFARGPVDPYEAGLAAFLAAAAQKETK